MRYIETLNGVENLRCLYITITLDSPVLRSQVLNWITVLAEQGIPYDLLVCIPISGLIRNPKKEVSFIDQLRTGFQGKIYTIPILRTKADWNFVSDLVRFFFLFGYVFRSKADRIIIQHRSSSNRRSLRVLQKLLPQVKVVFDLRGAAAEEYRDRFMAEYDGAQHDHKIYSEIRQSEMQSCVDADHVFCVSHRLRDYLTDMTPTLVHKISVIPGAADKNIFYFDLNLRRTSRAEFGFNDKNVIVYSGGLKSFWHQAERVFAFFKSFQNADHHSFIVCLTKDTDIAHKLCTNHDLDIDRLVILSINDSHVINKYYNASDLALLLRANLMTNYVSSPTKAAEYLMAGLPVLISESVGDYTDYITKNGFGLVVSDDQESVRESLMALKAGFNRYQISEVASRDYSKQEVTKKIIKSLHGLTISK